MSVSHWKDGVEGQQSPPMPDPREAVGYPECKQSEKVSLPVLILSNNQYQVKAIAHHICSRNDHNIKLYHKLINQGKIV
jgi:hypothetical protein